MDYPTPLFHALTQPMFLEAKELPTEGPAAQVLGLAGPVNSVTGRLTDGQADLGTTCANEATVVFVGMEITHVSICIHC